MWELLDHGPGLSAGNENDRSILMSGSPITSLTGADEGSRCRRRRER